MNTVIYRLNYAIQFSTFVHIHEYMRGKYCSNTRETHTQSKAEIMAVILRRCSPSETHSEGFCDVSK